MSAPARGACRWRDPPRPRALRGRWPLVPSGLRHCAELRQRAEGHSPPSAAALRTRAHKRAAPSPCLDGTNITPLGALVQAPPNLPLHLPPTCVGRPNCPRPVLASGARGHGHEVSPLRASMLARGPPGWALASCCYSTATPPPFPRQPRIRQQPPAAAPRWWCAASRRARFHTLLEHGAAGRIPPHPAPPPHKSLSRRLRLRAPICSWPNPRPTVRSRRFVHVTPHAFELSTANAAKFGRDRRACCSHGPARSNECIVHRKAG